MPPPITLFLTTIASHPELRRRQEYLLRILQVKKIPFNAYDMASDEQARRLWKRKVPPAKQALPGFLVDNTFIGTVDEFEVAVEQGDHVLRKFLKQDEDYNDEADRPWATPAPPVVAIGVPGAQLPSEISGHKPVFHGDRDKPVDKSKVVKHDQKLAPGEVDLTEALGEFGLEGVTVTADELAELVGSLGLEEKDADELLKGITESSAAANAPTVEESKAPEPSPAPPLPSPTAPITVSPSKPIVKIDTEAAPPIPPTSPPPGTKDALSPQLLSPVSGIMASRDIMAQLAQKVEAKRRTRTDMKPMRSGSLTPLTGTSPLPESPLAGGSPNLADSPLAASPIGETSSPVRTRERKPSVYESSKPKVAFPVTDAAGAKAEEAMMAASSPAPPPVAASRSTSSSTRERKRSTAGVSKAPPPSFPGSGAEPEGGRGSAPVRERKRSAAFGVSRPNVVIPAKPDEPVPPLPTSATTSKPSPKS